MNAPEPPKGLRNKLASAGGTVLALLLLVLAVWMFGRTLRQYDLHEVVQRVGRIPVHRLALALLFTGLSYFFQTVYDYLSAKSVHIHIAPWRAVWAAFIGNAFTNNIGFSLLTGTSLRFRFYLAWGFSPLQVAQFVALSKLAFVNGLFLFAGVAQIVAPVQLPASIKLPFPQHTLGWLLVLPTLALVIWNGVSRSETLSLGKLKLVRPAQSLFILQIASASVHFAFAAGTLYFALPAEALRDAGFANLLAFLGTFMAIKFVVMFVPVPGSLGVFEGASVAVLTPAIPAYPVLGALLAYRLIFYVVPFIFAMLMLLGYEFLSPKGLLASLLRGRKRSLTRDGNGGGKDATPGS
ncbi:MAG: lysylphosphatidylglycerol synthase domain-containing protein [Fibrobacteria bacterium]